MPTTNHSRALAGVRQRLRRVGTVAAAMLAFLAAVTLTMTGTAHAALPASIPVDGATAVAVLPQTHDVAVLAPSNGSVVIIDGATGTASRTVALPTEPRAMTVGPDGRTLYVAAANGTVYVVDVAAGTVTQAIVTGERNLVSITADPRTGRVYATANLSFRIVVIDATANTLEAPLATTSNGREMDVVAADPATGLLWFTRGGSVNVIDPETSTLLASVPTGVFNRSFVFDDTAGVVYADASYTGVINVIDTTTFARLDTIRTGVRGIAGALTRDPDTSLLFWVAEADSSDPDDDTVLVIDPARRAAVDRVPLPSGRAESNDPENSVAFDAASGTLFVSSPSTSEVLVFTVATISGSAPDGVTGSAYSFGFPLQGTPRPTVEVSAGALPPGLSVDSAGRVSGTPTTPGTYRFELSATNPLGRRGVTAASITITDAATATPRPSSEPSGGPSGVPSAPTTPDPSSTPTAAPGPAGPTSATPNAGGAGGGNSPSVGSPSGRLAFTGSDLALPGTLAAVLLLAGALIAICRRRSRA